MRTADLNPPLGYPGGPCYVVKRIQKEVPDLILQARLIHEIEEGEDLSNPEALKVYEVESVPGVGKVRQLVIGPHAQYRMDLRSVNIPAVRSALMMFQKQMNDWKSQDDWRFQRHSELLARGEGVNFTDPRMGLTIVFRMMGRDRYQLITTYWKGEPDPGHTHCITAYSQPVENLPGAKTLVKPQDSGSREPDSALPSPPNTRSKPTGRPQFLVPPSSDEAPGGKNLHEDRVRTKSEPGGDEHPWVDNSGGYNQVRPEITASEDVEAAMKGPAYPGGNRQRKQQGKARNYYKRRYWTQRGKIKQKAKRWYAKHRTDQRLKRDKERRREHPDKYLRKPGGGYHDTKDRSKDDREKNAGLDIDPVEFQFRPTGQWGWFLGADADTGYVHVDMDGERDLPVEMFFNHAAFESEEDVDRVFSYLDDLFYDPEFGDRRALTADSLGVLVQRQDDDVTPPDQRYNRGDEPEGTWPDKIPAESLNNLHEVDNNPGSAKVIPEGHGFVNKEAARISEIMGWCSEDLRAKAKDIKIQLKRVDTQNLMWLFEVGGSDGQSYKVKVKAVPKGNVKDMNKTDVMISCNCPYWRWQGPEYWAKSGDYLLGRPVGLATRPEVKDPSDDHRACKHALAVLKRVSTFIMPERFNMSVFKGKVASLRYLADRIAYGVVSGVSDSSVDRVAARYLSKVAIEE